MKQCLYVIDFEKVVKVGIAQNFEARLRQHELYTFMDAKRYYHTDYFYNALDLEGKIKRHYKESVIKGTEWLGADYDDVCAYVKEIYEQYALHEEKTDNRSPEEILPIVYRPLKQATELGDHARYLSELVDCYAEIVNFLQQSYIGLCEEKNDMPSAFATMTVVDDMVRDFYTENPIVIDYVEKYNIDISKCFI